MVTTSPFYPITEINVCAHPCIMNRRKLPDSFHMKHCVECPDRHYLNVSVSACVYTWMFSAVSILTHPRSKWQFQPLHVIITLPYENLFNPNIVIV